MPGLDPVSVDTQDAKQSLQVVLRSELEVSIGVSTNFLNPAANDSWKNEVCVSIVSTQMRS